ncbi:GxxExxY protein [Candidatus Uhrbacteria bacterium]|nr:GxxExxY protein [Candidatus Uhrbacteria bacterium]
MNKVIYPELSYRINGVLFATHNELGRFCNEKQYCDRIEGWLKKLEIPYKRELRLAESFEGEVPGRNRVDFLIDDKIILEIKAKRFVSREDYFQARRYQTAAQRKLVLLANFNQKSLHIKRIVNPSVSE